MSKLVCSEMMKVSVTSDDNFLHVCKDSISGDMYGTKEGWPAFELTPTDINESRGTEKFKPGIIVARVFRIKARKKWVAAGRRAFRNEFIGEKHTVFLVYLKGAYWGSAAPPDTEGQPKPDLFRDAICYINEDNHDRCIYEFGKMADVLEVLYKFETKTYTKWKGFRGKGLLDLKKKNKSFEGIYSIEKYTFPALEQYGNDLLANLLESGRTKDTVMYFYPGIGCCLRLRRCSMICERSKRPGDTAQRKLFTKSSGCTASLNITFWGLVNNETNTLPRDCSLS